MGSKGIRQCPINWCTMYISNDETQNYPLCRLQLVVERLDTQPINQNTLKVSKVVNPANKKIMF